MIFFMSDKHPKFEKQRVLVFAGAELNASMLYLQTNYRMGLIRSLIGVATLARKLHYYSEKTYKEISEMTRLSLLNRMTAYF